jgi:predicted TIM-barrel fold metal-dependent hydrolase
MLVAGYRRSMTSTSQTPRNAWRLEALAHPGWARQPHPDAAVKYFMVSADSHVVEPPTVFAAVPAEYGERLPRVRTDEDGAQWLICEGNRPQLVKPAPRTPTVQPLADFEDTSANRHPLDRMEDEDHLRSAAGKGAEQRTLDQQRDGIDAEIVFPTLGLLAWATPDPAFSAAMCHAWNEWARDYFAATWQTSLPMALVSAGDPAAAVSEVEWAAAAGFKGVLLGNQVTYGALLDSGVRYNDESCDPLWSALEAAGLPATFHVATGRDPRAVSGKGGALINYVCHAMTTTMEPLVQLLASGVFERHPGLRAGIVESGIGHVPWLLDSLDHAYRTQHFWVRPSLPELPSSYFRSNCFATFQIDPAGLALVERYDLGDNVLWANDYPHHEGTWPHSAEAIERTMGDISEQTRAKILGLNAARVFGLPVPG